MALIKEFDRELNALWDSRIAYTRSLLKKPIGRPKSFSKKDRDKRIRRLEELAVSILTNKKRAESELKKITRYTKSMSLWGKDRYDKMVTWVKKKPGPIVYSFWRKGKCLYIGQTKSAKERLRNYRKDKLFGMADRVKVHLLRGESHLGKAECLATHLYDPSGNRANPPEKKYSKKCPVCKAKREIKKDIESLFRMKRRRSILQPNRETS
jgi:predicted GIY-YIG superfamily endonuclease